ncbi:MAG: GTP-binding protein [Bacteroidales bacterium]
MSKVVLVTGFLGSGKTTLLKRILSEYSSDHTIAIIQNEFADASTDSTELKMGNWRFELVEINKGSIFCICRYDNFREELTKLVTEKSPQLILIEASGLADPISVGALLNNSNQFYLSHVISIIDPFMFLRMSGYIRSINNQVKVADTILINKADRTTEGEMEAVKAGLKVINPAAKVLLTSYGEISDGSGFRFDSILFGEETAGKNENMPFAGKLAESDNRTEHLHTPFENIHSNVFRTSVPVDYDVLMRFCKGLPESVIRVKGFVNCSNGKSYLLQYMSGEGDALLTECAQVPKTEIIAIGTSVSDLKFW